MLKWVKWWIFIASGTIDFDDTSLILPEALAQSGFPALDKFECGSHITSSVLSEAMNKSGHPPDGVISEASIMPNMVQCIVLGQEAEALDAPPHPGELGQRIFANVSRDGWKKWLDFLTTVINENGLNTADPRSIELVEKHMLGFFFGEGDYGRVQSGFRPVGGNK